MFFMRRRLAAFLFAVLLNCAFAQVSEDSDWYWNKPISSISFEGLNGVKKSELTGVTNQFIGQSFTDELYNDMLDRLYALSYFTDIEPFAKHDPRSPDKILLVFKVTERPTVSSISFVGNKKIRNNELRDAVSMKAGDVFVDSAVLSDERALRDLYIKKGFMDARISHTAEETEDGMKVTFSIGEGSGTVITKIQFSGNTVFSERTLKGRLSLKEEGFMKGGAFQRSSLEADKQAVVAYYMTRGYIDARIVDVVKESVVNEKKEREELTLTFIIQEGSQYTFNGISISGNEIFSTERLLSFVKLKAGDIFNQTKFTEGISGITNLYYENGYMSNEFYPNASKDAERRIVSYSLQIVEHPRAHIESIIIKGNTKTKEHIILRELPFQPGDIFSRDKIMSGIRNLYNTQYFSSIVPEPVPGSEENLVDLVISVEEQSTTSLQFGMTFSGIEDPDDLPISLFAKWQNSNLMGLGNTVSAGATIASGNQSVDFSYGQPWLFGRPIQFSESLTFYHADDSAPVINFLPDGRLDDELYYMNYQSWGMTLNSSLGRRWIPNFAIVTLAGGMTNNFADNIYDEGLYVPLDSGVNKYANRLGMKNSLYASVSLDNRDISYDPSRGWFMSERLAWYGLIPGLEKEFYMRADTKLEAYLKLFDIPIADGFWNFKAVLAAMTGVTAIFPMPNTLFGYSSKVSVDGMFNGRGWTDIYNKVRGETMLSNSVELRIPIFQGILGIDGFFDAVAVKDRSELERGGIKIDDFYFSFGPGIRFLIPQFPLHLLFANKFRIQDGDVKWEKPWQFVLSFNIANR